MTEKFPDLKRQFDALAAEKAEIEARSAPVRSSRDAFEAQIRPLEAQSRELAKQIAAIERPRLAEICNAMGALAKAMGGRSMSQGTDPAE